jgi:Rod binding domain-containing protein
MSGLSFPIPPAGGPNATDALRDAQLKRLAGKDPDAKIGESHKEKLAAAKRTAKEFESLLVTRMISAMRESVPDSGLTEDAASGQMKDMFWHFMGEEIGSSGGLGVWKQVLRQIQESEGLIDNNAVNREVSP